jgi:alkaline phosphatase D
MSLEQGNVLSAQLLEDNPDLMFSETYFRGYFELHITEEQVDARFFGVPTVAERTPYELSIANFTVVSGENCLSRPVGGGRVESGAIRGGEVKGENVTWDTSGEEGWGVRAYEMMYILNEGDEERLKELMGDGGE